MKKKRSKFLTVMFSMIPGAGQMFMGFMKIGTSLMSIFFAALFLIIFLNLGPLALVLPIIWFYSFFDGINRLYSSDEEFNSMEDTYLFSFVKFNEIKGFKKGRLYAGLLLLLFGVIMIWNSIIDSLWRFVPEESFDQIRSIASIIPQIIVGIVIIFVGIKLIIGKKKESDCNE